MAACSERENGRLSKTVSIESKWVFQEEDEIEDCREQPSFDSVEDDFGEQRLIRTGPSIDSFDVEAFEIPGAQRHDYEEFRFGRNIILAIQTLGVVFGDVGTSPLYTFDVVFNKYSISGKTDVLGALSLVLYTLIMIPFLKYTLIVLWGNDDGEGGTFALYSLICRNAKANLLPNQLPSDARISSFRLKVPSPELERSLKLKEILEASEMLKKLLLLLVLFGISMVIAGGVVTPAMSVMSALNGLKIGIASVEQGEVVIITVTSLVMLFSVQKFGTSKVGLAVGPALLIWFCCLGGVGVCNLIKYGTTAFRAFNPVYIFCYFKGNPTKAWMSLGGCLLCATGSEAMFADLCYFSVRSVQLTFIFLVLPCLLLGYLGQAAFLLENLTQNEHVFFSSIPSEVFWPVVTVAMIAALIASRAVTTATFSCIKQATALGYFPRLKIIHTSRKFMGQIYIPVINWFLLVFCLGLVSTFGSIYEIGNAYGIVELGIMMTTTVLVTIIMLLTWQIKILLVTCFLVFFLGSELLFFSSVLGGMCDGSWVILAFASAVFLIMFIWNYGSKLKYETEVKQKLSADLMLNLGCNLGTVRAPGIGLLYNELVKGIPAIFGHFLTALPAIHSMVIFVCIKYVPVPIVPQSERFLFRRVCPKGYHIFRCMARYGYKDARKENQQSFEQLLIESLESFIQREAQERSLESGEEEEEEKDGSLGVPLLAGYGGCGEAEEEGGGGGGGGGGLERELSFIRAAKESGVVYLLGHSEIRARKDSCFLKKLSINYLYAFLRRNCRRGIATLTVPHTNLIRVRMTYMV